MTRSSVRIQIMPESKPSTPSWMGEVAAFAQVLTHTGILKKIQEHVRFARARFGQYDLIDFVAVLIGSVLSGEPTLLSFYERLVPCAEPFMALFGRNLLPHRSTLSRFLAALDQASVEALRTLFHKDLLSTGQVRAPFLCPLLDFSTLVCLGGRAARETGWIRNSDPGVLYLGCCFLFAYGLPLLARRGSRRKAGASAAQGNCPSSAPAWLCQYAVANAGMEQTRDQLLPASGSRRQTESPLFLRWRCS